MTVIMMVVLIMVTMEVTERTVMGKRKRVNANGGVNSEGSDDNNDEEEEEAEIGTVLY